MDKKLFIMGAPGAGKSTYLAALWHSVNQDDLKTMLTLKKMDKDTQYLYTLEKKWLAVEDLERTAIGQEVSEIRLLLTDGNQDLVVEFPDLSGETFQNIYEDRNISKSLYEKIREADAILYFINVEAIYHGELIAEVSPELRETETATIKEREPSRDDPTQIQIIDLLQIIAKIKRNRIKLGIIFSAWDLVDKEDKCIVDPYEYLKNEMHMLWQYLMANYRLFDTMMWGVSALGGKVSDSEKLLAIEDPVMRIRVVGEDKCKSHDVTSIIAKILGDKDEYYKN